MNGVSLRDARALVEVAAAAEYDTHRGCLAEEGLTALLELLRADWVTYCEGPIGARCWEVRSEVETRPFPGHTRELEATFAVHYDEFLLGSYRPPGGVVLIGDRATDRAWRRTSFYNEWCRQVQIEPQAKISLCVPGAPIGGVLMFDLADDAGWRFGERQRTLLTLARQAFMGSIARVAHGRARRRALGITPRELEVLGFVRDGMTNREIARQLFVSPATVRSHLEHAFAKLGAHTRTEAVARLGEIS